MDVKKLQPIWRLISIIVILLFVYFTLRYVMKYIYPFILAFVLASILHPIVSYLETRWHMHRTIATTFIMMLFLSISTLISFFLFQQLGKELGHLLSMLPAMYMTVNQLLTDVVSTYLLPMYQSIQALIPWLPSDKVFNLEQITTLFTDELLQFSMMTTQTLFKSLTGFISSISQIMIIILFISISGFMMTKDYRKLQQFYNEKMPKRVRSWLTDIHIQLKKSTLGMMKAHFLLALLTSFIAMLGLYFFRLEHVLLLSLVILIVDFIPYIGVGFIFIPWIIYQFIIGNYELTIWLTCLYMVIIIIRQIIEPKMIASHTGLHPLVTVILLFITINLFGLLGIFLTPIIFIVISALYHTKLIPITWHYIIDKK